MPETPHHRSAVKFKEFVEERTHGRVEVDIFPSGQLGSAQEMFEGLQFGTQEIALLPTARISGFAPKTATARSPIPLSEQSSCLSNHSMVKLGKHC